MNILKLKGKIVENGLTIPEFSRMINLDPATVYRKLNKDGNSFTIAEANKIVEALKLSKEDAMSIFFSKFVA